MHKIRRGLDLPIAGAPQGAAEAAPQISRVAVMAADHVGMKPTMHVKVGDSVQRGQLLFEDKKTPGVRYTAIGDGKIVAINRGDRRALQSVVIELTAAERGGRGGDSRFQSFTGQHPNSMTREQVKALLLESGQWIALRQRPFSRVPAPDSVPGALFVTATDSQPLAPDPAIALGERSGDFERGLTALGKLTDGPIYVCTRPGLQVTLPSQGDFRHEEFAGPHPAGTAGLQVHLLAPVSRQRTIWWIGYQEVLAMGTLFESGNLDLGRVVSLDGPGVKRPRILQTRVGACLDDIVVGELEEGEQRVISGSALYGRTAMGEVHGYLGRHHNQITALREGREREFLGWLTPGLGKHSVTRTFLSKLTPGRRFNFTTTKNGSDRAIVPIGVYEKVFPFDWPPSNLMRALAAGDQEQAIELGVLELDEEDLALCSYVCPGKHDYGSYLRDILTTIEKEG
ncbi:MAG: Na(+)-translocating NADH-quinone reductase subunit A [Acidobacteria bacterium]|nr:Na(+)-translocating NADH-quinone reductase subunit A [Acidobacteriota bacterium]